ncbi:hydroxypyruvate isomerase family protein [Naasia aerilata]|uniref:Hydroxypyruvate isomerase n=1 Tax=Naasia aerilata TaxID=1162966 RepID=A0ABM8G7F4_9MICO|nr:TIM barrel protein [Naasia aerilata]BDZ44092.1 hydroxypyruvate isomerase [Naasia aerilata]BDZ47704.1 hydroxypyruvate isomerase [Naasia aerilata]
MLTLAPNIDLLYTEVGNDLTDRVRAAAADGFDTVEMWGTAGRDVPALAAALQDSGVALSSTLVLPRTNFAWPNADLEAFYAGLTQTMEDARTLGCPRVVVGTGAGFGAMKRPAQQARFAEILTEGLDRTAELGVAIVLEPVNSRVDHPGAFLDHTEYAIQVARAVGSPRLTILYDLYHSITQGEDVERTLAELSGLVGYVQLADVPGRGEPGSGTVDWSRQLRLLRDSGYDGVVGLEYVPTQDTSASTRAIRQVLDEITR